VTARIQRRIVPVTPFQQNCSLVWSVAERRGVVIDPGGDLDHLRAALRQEDIVVEKILLTHAHLDHAGGARVLADELGVPIEGPHRDDAFWLEAMPEQSRMFGFPETVAFTPDRWLEQDDTVTFGDQSLAVLHCPGHTPGHVVFHHADGVAFVGDVLFAGSVGRTDFPRGDHAQLIDSIRTRLWPLGDETVFVPGHGPESTFGQERKLNPFVADRLFDAR
jgi:glyoxylase-like metal-dependent hydrolase (beta-lactamase superfamily II)